jgi:hypothetical protein
MGTLSNRGLGEFGHDIRDRIEGLSDKVGSRIDGLSAKAELESRREGTLTKKLEKLTAALPSTTWLIAAAVSFAGSITLRLLGRKTPAWYVGMGVPAFLLIGIYNKIVKVKGSDRNEAMFEGIH